MLYIHSRKCNIIKNLVSNPEILDFQQCVDRGIIDMIHSRMQHIQDESIKTLFYSWCQYNTRSTMINNTKRSRRSATVPIIPSKSDSNDDQCLIM